MSTKDRLQKARLFEYGPNGEHRSAFRLCSLVTERPPLSYYDGGLLASFFSNGTSKALIHLIDAFFWRWEEAKVCLLLPSATLELTCTQPAYRIAFT